MVDVGQRRHEENVERIARLEEKFERLLEYIAEIRSEMRPMSQAFEQAKGIKAAVMFIGVLVVGGIGAGSREILTWLLSALGKH